MLDSSRTPHPEILRRPPGMISGPVVSCVGCGNLISLATASIAGLGYRCQACANRVSLAKASGSFPVVMAPPRPRRRASRAGSELIAIGILVLALGAIAAPLLFWWAGIAAMIVGGLTMMVGVMRRTSTY